MLPLAPLAAYIVLLGPVIFGLLATVLPAFGFFPALGGQGFSLEPFQTLLAVPGITQSSLISLFTGLAASLIATISVALFVAGWSSTKSFRLMQGFLSPLLSIPHAAAAFGLAFLIAPSGWIMRILSPELTGFTRPPDWLIIHDSYGLAMTAGLVIKEIPFLFLVALAALPQTHPRRTRQVATSLGYGRIAGSLLVIWPGVYRQIRLAVFAVIAYSTSVVDVAIILGPTNPAPLAVRLVQWMNDPDISLRFMASAGALLQLGITFVAIVLWIVLERMGRFMCVFILTRGFRMQRDGLIRYGAAAFTGLCATLATIGLAILAIWSFAGYWPFPDALPGKFSLRNWTNGMDSIWRPAGITITIALLATLVAAIITVGSLEHAARKSDIGQNRRMIFLFLPLIVPQASFVFGLKMFFLMTGMDNRLISVVLVHLVFVLPYVFLSLSDPWRAYDPRYNQLALALGKTRNQVLWKIRLPMLLRALLVASAVGFSVSIGQYLPTLLIGGGRWPTITTEAVALSSGGDRRIIGIYALIQMALPFAGFALAAFVPWLFYRNRKDMKPA